VKGSNFTLEKKRTTQTKIKWSIHHSWISNLFNKVTLSLHRVLNPDSNAQHSCLKN
jgi:hypothetical protein